MTGSASEIPTTTFQDGSPLEMPVVKAASVYDPAVRAWLCGAEILLARDATTRRATPLYGSERLRALMDRPPGSPPVGVKLIAIEYVPDAKGLDLAIAATLVCKGSCDLYTPDPAATADGTVTVLDPATGKRTTMPADRLTPGMLRMRLGETGEEVWVPADRIAHSPVKHPPFTADVMRKLRGFARTFRDVYPRTLEQWEEGFRREVDPAREIALWEHLERCYLKFTRGVRWLRRRQDICSVVVMATVNGVAHVEATVRATTLSRERVREIAAYVVNTYRPAVAAGG